jgi:competence protein ComEC
MKIPAVALAAAFGGGIVLGLQPEIASHINSAQFVMPAILGIAAVVCLGLALTVRDRLVAAGTPLRWHGRLRSEPARLPCGYGIDVDLSGVDEEGEFIPVSGGLRVGFTPKEEDASLPEVRAGDEVAGIAQARLPQVYRDAGAFDRKEFLTQQNIHLLGTLRASSLLTKTGPGAPTIASWLARLRGQLRERLDEMFVGAPQAAAVLRAMLLGDRSFIERNESVDYQKTGVFHVLVVAGLHIGALAFFLFWVGRRLRLPQSAAMVAMLAMLFAYIAVVEQRPPVLRTGLMTAIW